MPAAAMKQKTATRKGLPDDLPRLVIPAPEPESRTRIRDRHDVNIETGRGSSSFKPLNRSFSANFY